MSWMHAGGSPGVHRCELCQQQHSTRGLQPNNIPKNWEQGGTQLDRLAFFNCPSKIQLFYRKLFGRNTAYCSSFKKQQCTRPPAVSYCMPASRSNRSAAFSPTIATAAFVFAPTMDGMMDASATANPATPRTLRSGVTTPISSESGAILHVPGDEGQGLLGISSDTSE